MIRGIEGKAIFRDHRARKEFVIRLGKLTKELGTRGVGGDGDSYCAWILSL
jgi:hypothetical protein